MKLKELIFKDEYTSVIGSFDIEIENVTTDINKIESNTLFVFIKSDRFDIKLIKDGVTERKPIAVLCDTDFEIDAPCITVIKADDTRALLPYLYYRINRIDGSKVKICAVTGTNGKTSTAYILQRILIESGNKVGFIGTGKIMIDDERINGTYYSMTTPDPELLYSQIARMINEKCSYIVMEVSSHALHFKKTLPLRFSVSVFTNLSEEHLDFHKNMEEYYRTKSKLFEASETAVFNLDDPYSRRAKSEAGIISLGVSINSEADFKVKDLKEDAFLRNEFTIREPAKEYRIALKLVGRFNVYNATMAIAAARLLGVSSEICANAVGKIKSIDGRMEAITGDVTVIIDYAHTPIAFENVLFSINTAKNTKQNLITVFGCGGERDKTKRPKMARISEKYSNTVIVTTDNSRNENTDDIIKDIISGFTRESNHTVIKSREEAIEYAVLNSNDGDIIALLGKGHERYSIVNNEYIPFDERKIVLAALKKRRMKSGNKT